MSLLLQGVNPQTLPATAVVLPLIPWNAATPAAVDVGCQGGRSMTFNINITVLTGTAPTLTFTDQGWDEASGTWQTYLVSAALAATGFTQLVISPHIASAANTVKQLPLPTKLRLTVAPGGTVTTATYSVSAILSQ